MTLCTFTLFIAATMLVSAAAFAAPPSDGLYVDGLENSFQSHDGSFFAHYYARNVDVPDPVVMDSAGDVQPGVLTLLTEQDLETDSVWGGVMRWVPFAPLSAGEYTVSFDTTTVGTGSGTMTVDPALSLAVVYGEPEADTPYVDSFGDQHGGLVCCVDSLCFNEFCDCGPGTEFLVATATLAHPMAPNSVLLRAEYNRPEALSTSWRRSSPIAARSNIDAEGPLCFDIEVLDSALSVIQTDEVCADRPTAPAGDRVRAVSYSCETCVVESSAEASGRGCDEDPQEGPQEESDDSGCATAQGHPQVLVLLVLALLASRRR